MKRLLLATLLAATAALAIFPIRDIMGVIVGVAVLVFVVVPLVGFALGVAGTIAIVVGVRVVMCTPAALTFYYAPGPPLVRLLPTVAVWYAWGACSTTRASGGATCENASRSAPPKVSPPRPG
jgi:hypothetical protein